MPLFSVVIPVFNRADLIGLTLDSVFAQSFTDYEVIVVDDGSTDATPGRLAEYGDRIRVIRQANAGPGAARNRGVEAAAGRYVAFLDSDDLWFPWTLATYERAIRDHDAPAFIAGTFVMLRDGQREPVAGQSHLTEAFADYLRNSRSPTPWYGGTCGVAVRADVLRASLGFTGDRVNAEDLDLWLRLGEAGRFVQVIAPPVFAYRQHQGNLVGNLSRSLDGVWRLIRHERAGRYPGGAARRADRLRILTRWVRQVSLECLRAGRARDAWGLYRAAFPWHLRLARLQYLLAFPFLALWRTFRRSRS